MLFSFRDDASEYGYLCPWIESKLKPLSLDDHEVTPRGLTPRANIVVSSPERSPRERHHLDLRRAFEVLCRGLQSSSPIIFTWAEVQSLSTLPVEDEEGLCFIALSTQLVPRLAKKGNIFQATNTRDRALWGLRMAITVVNIRCVQRGSRFWRCVGASGCMNGGGLSVALAAELMWIACEVACFRPAVEYLERLGALLRLLTQIPFIQNTHGVRSCAFAQPPIPAGSFPEAAIKRFEDPVTLNNAHVELAEWGRRRRMARLSPRRGCPICSRRATLFAS